MFCNVWVTGQIEDEIYAACAKDVQIELPRWPTFRHAVEQWLSNYPEHKDRPIFQPVARTESPTRDAAV